MAFRSFRGHMRLLSPKGMPGLVFGDATDQPEQGRASAQTLARSGSIESLSATHPWADLVDKQIFLMGYRAALQQGSYTPDSDIQTAKR
jgi:hypothetical protein